ncbi:hypothetical protein BDV96DRAFT_171955 [Lophiotrema nucula]|uniref:Uncharacterized protein n=1 Tax=Lophiotrema nucula TaxID=690887 RepID=A0A6A5YZF4_9PLEO|nr:hypothetical protein BDV96DRAFT_171955 [Lophiotrema nucula]
MSDDQESYRTPLSLLIKTITTHAFALANYAYVSNLLRRPTRSNIQALRILFFLFVPTLPLVEIIISFLRSLLQFLRNYEDDEEIHVRYYLSAALGVHANLSQDDDNKDTKSTNKNMHLLDVGSACAEKHVMPIDWVWAGKFLATLFTLTQAIGSIVMWVRRIKSHQADAFSIDHRNGAMGIASAICSVICLLVLILRLNWKVSKSFAAPLKERALFGGQTGQFVTQALLSMLLHLGIATTADRGNRWLYTSVGSVAFLCTGSFQAWQSLLLVVFMYIFRHEIMRRIGVSNEQYAKYLGDRRWKRVKILLGFALAVWVLVDIIWLLVVDIIQVVESRRRHDYYYWWQDPISDELIVI